MKLLKQTSLNFISASVFFFLIAIITVYISVRMMANYYLETELFRLKEQYTYHFEEDAEPTRFFNTNTQLIDLSQTAYQTLDLNTTQFSDTIIFDPVTKSYQLNKQLKFYAQKEQKTYEVRLLEPQSFIDIYVMIFGLSLLSLVVLLFLLLFIVHRHSIRFAMQVFYKTIHQLSHFNANDQLELDQDTDIDEFRQLNTTVNSMSERIRQDFLNLKQYSENTSHELQTPLAILSAKLEELLQSENLTEQQMIDISNLISTVDRLSNINKALIFLTKIDNHIFIEKESVSVQDILENQIVLYQDLMDSRGLKLSKKFENIKLIRANRLLLETLISNLLGNAIKHNIEDGSIKINLDEHHLQIKNTGKKLNVPVEQLFQRFEKGNSGAKSLGIGLSIVKKICETSDFKIDYQTEDIWHNISIRF